METKKVKLYSPLIHKKKIFKRIKKKNEQDEGMNLRNCLDKVLLTHLYYQSISKGLFVCLSVFISECMSVCLNFEIMALGDISLTMTYNTTGRFKKTAIVLNDDI